MSKKVMREHMRERFGKVFNYSLVPPLPRSLNVELNNTCNQQCFFCPYHGQYAEHKVKPSVLKPEFVKKILDQAAELGIGKKELGFYLAGEVFLYKELPDIIKYAKDKGFPYTFITTNGALGTREKMEAVVNAGLDSIRFSVNAGDRDTYREVHQRDDFDAVLDNIKYLDKYRKENNINIAVSLSCVVTKKTEHVIADVKKIFSPYVDDILFIPIIFSGLTNLEELKADYQIVEDTDETDPDFICPMLFDTMYINSSGKIVPCCDAYYGDVQFADLYETLDLKTAWHNEKYARYRNIFIDNAPDENTICKTCILRRKGVNRLTIDDEL